MKIIRSEAMGFCFGVRDALDAAARVENPERVTIHGELVHNEAVLVQLESRGFGMASEHERDSVPSTPEVLITAHGVSDRERQRLADAGKRLIDTTCPLVTRAHRAARMLEAEGRLVIVIGKPGHVEVRGIVEDLAQFDVVCSPESVRKYETTSIGVLCQTTTPPRLADEIISAIRQLNPEADVRVIDTICQPTRDRQTAVERMLPLVDAMVVVGGRNSNNTRQLAALCESAGKRVIHVQSADDLDANWFASCQVVGLTAGTSTPDDAIHAVYRALCQLSCEPSTPENAAVHSAAHTSVATL